MRGLTKTALNRPVSCLMIIIALVFFSISSITGFKMELTPEMDMPMLIVSAVYPGADAETVEELVTREIEDAGSALNGIKTVTSTSAENYCMVVFQYEYGTDIDDAYSDLKAALDLAKSDLPEDANEPVIMEMDMNATAVVTISATAVGDVDVLSYVEDELEPELQKISTVADVTITGGRESYVQILLDREKLQQYGLTMSGIAQYIAATDFSLPLGSMTQGSQDIAVTSSAKAESLQELRNVPITTSTGALITLADVAEVNMAEESADSISRYNGNDSISIDVTKQQSAGSVDVAKEIKALVERLDAETDAVELRVIYDASEQIVSSLLTVAGTLVSGVIFSMLVLFIFFGDWKASLIVGSSMPISLLATVICMSFAGFSLNLITTGSLVIAIGMMVDSSIVVLESCFRAKEQEADFKEAALKGAATVAASVVASTITTVVVYLPLSMMDGLSGQMFSQLGYTIIFAMLSSLLVSITLIPLFFSKYRPVEKVDTIANRVLYKVSNGYKSLMKHMIYKRKTVVITAVLLLIGAFALAGGLDVELMPSTGSDTVSIQVEFRAGTTLEVMNEAVLSIEERLQQDNNFDAVNLSISGTTAVFSAYIAEDAELDEQELTEKYTKEYANAVNMDIGVSATSSDSMGAMMSTGVEIDLAGDNLDLLQQAAAQVEDAMRSVNGVLKVTNGLSQTATKVKVKVDPLLASANGLTASQAAMEIYYALSGMEALTVTWNGEEYSVNLEYPEGEYQDTNDIMGMVLNSPTGARVPMAEIARLEYTDAPQSIERTDGKYQIAVTATTEAGKQFDAQAEMDNLVAKMEFPEGVGEAESMMNSMMGEEFASLFGAIITAIFLVFMVMAMQFESPKFSLMVMLSIPFSMIGSFALLYICNMTMSMVSLMGILMLVGIVVNNGILFVDTTNQLRKEMPLDQALIEAGALRLRPILMTTLTTILSMILMALDNSSSGVMMKGMALIIIGGLVTSTLLILLLLPSFYLLLDKEGKQEVRFRKLEKREQMVTKKSVKSQKKYAPAQIEQNQPERKNAPAQTEQNQPERKDVQPGQNQPKMQSMQDADSPEERNEPEEDELEHRMDAQMEQKNGGDEEDGTGK